MKFHSNAQTSILLAAAFALGLALVSQYAFGFHPCELCIYQRWEYVAVIIFGFASFKFSAFKYLLIIALLAVFGTAAFHFGIEQKWWEGFSTCSISFDASSLEGLKAEINAAPVVRCDEATWFFLGLSMAGWNVLYSGFLIIYAIKSLLGWGRPGRSGTAHS